MELYPAHRLFLACETAVYVLVVSAVSAERVQPQQLVAERIDTAAVGRGVVGGVHVVAKVERVTKRAGGVLAQPAQQRRALDVVERVRVRDDDPGDDLVASHPGSD